jgi:hypothetical protein
VAETETLDKPVTTPVETITKTETPTKTVTKEPPPRRSAVRDISHKVAPKATSVDKAAIAAKMDSARFDSAMKNEGAEESAEGGKKFPHRVAKAVRTKVGTPAEEPAHVSDTAEKKEEEKKEEKETKSETVKAELSPEVRRSLAAMGYDEKTIDAKLEKGDESFLDMARMAHKIRTSEVEGFARLGQAQGAKPIVVEPPVPVSTVAAPNIGLSLEEIAQFEKQYPDDPTVKLMAKEFKANHQFRTQQAQLQHRASEAALQNQVNSFFAQEAMKPYAEHYKEKAKQDAVIERAAQVITGARYQGKEVSLNDAMTMAHDSLMAPVIKAAVRKELESEVAKRDAAISQRNVGGSTTTEKKSKQPLTRKELENKLAARIAAIR